MGLVVWLVVVEVLVVGCPRLLAARVVVADVAGCGCRLDLLIGPLVATVMVVTTVDGG